MPTAPLCSAFFLFFCFFVFFLCVFSQGPGGGKSTALGQVSDRLKAYGFQVFSCPEV
jgi:hypothetical protein